MAFSFLARPVYVLLALVVAAPAHSAGSTGGCGDAAGVGTLLKDLADNVMVSCLARRARRARSVVVL